MITKNPFFKRKVQYINTDRGFLTQDEIDTLAGLRFDRVELEQARDIFLFCCFTGLSYSDLCNLKKENIQLSFDGKLWIKGRRQKTDTEYDIQLLNIPKMILEKNEKQQTDTDSKFLPVRHLQKYNSLLKEVVKAGGIDMRINEGLGENWEHQ
jgi:integrase